MSMKRACTRLVGLMEGTLATGEYYKQLQRTSERANERSNDSPIREYVSLVKRTD